jgi:hypothetical protein
LPKTPRLPKTAKIENQKLTAENAEGAEKDLKVKTECLGRTPYGFFLKEGSAEILRHALNSLRRFERLRMTGPWLIIRSFSPRRHGDTEENKKTLPPTKTQIQSQRRWPKSLKAPGRKVTSSVLPRQYRFS